MFEATQWSLQESQDRPTEVISPDGSRRLTIVKKNEFDHAKATMSVVVKDQDDQHFVFCKASNHLMLSRSCHTDLIIQRYHMRLFSSLAIIYYFQFVE